MENLLDHRHGNVRHSAADSGCWKQRRSYVAKPAGESLSSYICVKRYDAYLAERAVESDQTHEDSPRRLLARSPEYHFAYGVFFTACRFRSGVPSDHHTGPRSPSS